MPKFRVEENDDMDCPRVAYYKADNEAHAIQKFVKRRYDQEITLKEIEDSFNGSSYLEANGVRYLVE
jgi:predicted transcriptional regulator